MITKTSGVSISTGSGAGIIHQHPAGFSGKKFMQHK
jgi:hypothetical protein